MPNSDLSSWHRIVNVIFFIMHCLRTQRYRDLISAVRSFYFNGSSNDVRMLDEYVMLLSDLNFVYHQQKAAGIHAHRSNGATFFYQ